MASRFRRTTVCVFLISIVTTAAQGRPTGSDMDSLISILGDRHAALPARERAAVRLGEIRGTNDAAIAALVGCFAEHDPFLCGKAATSLGRIGAAAIPRLLTAMQKVDDTVRWCSAIALGKMSGDRSAALPALTAALHDRSSDVRWCAAAALGNMGRAAASALPALRAVLERGSEDEEVKWAAYAAIVDIGSGDFGGPTSLQAATAAIDSMLPALMHEYHVPGVSVVLVSDRKIAWSKSYGLHDSRTGEKVTPQTLFEACSMSKPVLAYLTMKLVDRRMLDLDTPLSVYLPEHFFSAGNFADKVTARMVLSHTAGFPNWRKGEEEHEGPLPIFFLPGVRFSYSGEGYYYLQRVVEKLTHEPLEVYAESELFGPLQMSHASFVWRKDLGPLIATGHDTAGMVLDRTHYSHANAAYSLYISAEDYARMLCCLLAPEGSGDVALSKGAREAMFSRQVEVQVRSAVSRPGTAMGLSVFWGLGWAIDSTITGNIVYHSGANRSGFRCYAQFRMDHGTGIVIMTNGLNGSDMWRRVIQQVGDF